MPDISQMQSRSYFTVRGELGPMRLKQERAPYAADARETAKRRERRARSGHARTMALARAAIASDAATMDFSARGRVTARSAADAGPDTFSTTLLLVFVTIFCPRPCLALPIRRGGYLGCACSNSCLL